MVVLALAATPGRAKAVAGLTALVGHGHRIVSWHHHVRPVTGRRPAALVAADVDVLAEMARSALDLGAPVVCRVSSPDEVGRAEEWGVVATFAFTSDRVRFPDGGSDLVSGVSVVETSAGQHHVGTKSETAPLWVPARGLDLATVPVMPLLTRSRLRLAHGLPEDLVLAVDGAASVADRSTSLALASAAVVSDSLVPLALALGTPSIVSNRAARRFGLEAGREVLVADNTSEADRLAASLARHEDRAAALSGHARRFAEDHFDLGPSARELRVGLGLERPPSLIDLRLTELATPPWSRLSERVGAALSLFTLEPTP